MNELGYGGQDDLLLRRLAWRRRGWTVLLAVAVVINCHNLVGLKEQKFVFSQVWRPEILNQYCRAEIKVLVGLVSLQML